jgi:DNA-directed RNA polymerase subunit RPC12/RpoP
VIEFKCSSCGEELEAENGDVGKKAKCLKCGTVLDVPYPQLMPHLQCPHCLQDVDFPVSAAGNIEKCPKCGGMIHVPSVGGEGKTGCAALTSLLGLLVGVGIAWLTVGR